MKKLIFLFLVFYSPILFAQENENSKREAVRTVYTVEDRLHVDFEIKDNPQLDRTILEQINLTAIDEQRQPNIRVEITDQFTGLTIIIYSATEATNNKTIRFSGSEE